MWNTVIIKEKLLLLHPIISHTYTYTHTDTKLFKWKENSTVIVKKYRVYKQN